MTACGRKRKFIFLFSDQSERLLLVKADITVGASVAQNFRTGRVLPTNKKKNMCGLFDLTTTHEAVRQLFPKDWEWKYVGGSTQTERIGPSAKNPGNPSNDRLVVQIDEDVSSFVSMRWRFESKWMRDKKVRIPINAKSETMFTNGLFRYAARDKRCLVITDGFYEPKGPKGTKREQYLFTFPERRPFAMGGLWTRFRDDHDDFEGFVICTTRPNDQVGAIHGRMPVILDDEAAWLSWLTGNQDDVMMLCEPIDRPELASKRVS